MNTPKFVISKSKVVEQFNEVAAHCDIVSYSSKTNQEVTRLLEEGSDAMFSVHFENELKHVTDCSRVVFLAQAWTVDEIHSLYGRGIRWFIVDNETDLDTLLSFLEKNEATINLQLRLKLKENTIRTERYYVFGMHSDVISRRVKKLSHNTKIKSLGIHFHRKTQNMAEWSIEREINDLFDEQVLDALDYLNIGGGLPAQYANTNIDVLPAIWKKIDALREWLTGKDIKLIIEPGRFIAAPAVKLVTTIKAIHGNTLIVNASVYNSDMDAIIVPVKLRVEGELERTEGTAYVIKGITPCSLDLFRYRVYLNNPQVGDQVVFLNAGAYNFTTDFCDLEKIESEVVE